MTIEDLKNAKLSPVTAEYLGAYIKLSDIYGEVEDLVETNYCPECVNKALENFEKAMNCAMEEVMKFAAHSMNERLCTLDNHTEI
ncbi:hypothetical protein [uncultured Alistipes sp.]|uniref:hypothetical protein n=1 Tax=uncultured Alistipes sp. TaxID=538949 RepID=UPI003209BE34